MPSSWQFLACAAVVIAAGPGAHGSEPVDGAARELAGPLAELRQRGCEMHPGTDRRLQWPAELADAARRIARGEPPLKAARDAGYRPRKVYHVRLSGYRSAPAVVRTIARDYCTAITDPQFTGAGAHREGGTYWIVLAALHRMPGPADAPEVAAQVLALTNEARSQPRSCGNRHFEAAAPLRPNGLLGRAALAHAQDMARHGYLAHEGRDGSTVGQRLDRVGYRWRSAGENIASGQGTAEEVVRDWLRSPQHCAAIMNPGFTEMGVAFALDAGSERGIYWAQEFGRER